MRTIAQPRVLAAPHGRVRMTPATADEIPAAFVVDIRETEGRFVAAGRVGAEREVATEAVPLRQKSVVVAELAAAMKGALVAEGLNDDEAVAMVRTWTETWFSANGTRVVYLVPRPVTDATLPLRITPAPDKLVRVLVGRVEFMTPEKEDTIRQAILAASRPESPDTCAAGMRAIAALDRFAEPAVRAIGASAARAHDDATREAAALVLPRVSAR
jgi:hypothetical protein